MTHTRETVLIPVTSRNRTVHLHTWLYKPSGSGPFPLVIAGHGLTVIKAAGLADFGEAWADRAGYASLILDYRGFGDSEGEPRNIVSLLKAQREDYEAVIAWAKAQPDVFAGDKIVVMGSALSGLVVARLVCERKDLAGGMAHCPLLDGYTTLMALPANPRMLFWAAVDYVKGKLGLAPVFIPTIGLPGEFAFVTTPSCVPGFQAMFALGNVKHTNMIAPRVSFDILGDRPGLRLKDAHSPMLVVMAEEDDLTQPSITRAVIDGSNGKATLVVAPGGHFDVMKGGKGFETNINAQLTFLNSLK